MAGLLAATRARAWSRSSPPWPCSPDPPPAAPRCGGNPAGQVMGRAVPVERRQRRQTAAHAGGRRAVIVLTGPGPADFSSSIAAANHAAELIDNRPLSPEGYLAFIGSLIRLGAADISRAVDLGPTTDK